ncbi:hypothetical protein QUC31_007280 [Theobroma cacao]|uniref:Uncharacterized protein isoform 1 n=1 Tax=Theobroma cacao TaxID=3641 RepID=A0A061FVS5_THECC|nr:Uncharacterized protein TCM_012841 isoform 1 [Theobroma cacao]
MCEYIIEHYKRAIRCCKINQCPFISKMPPKTPFPAFQKTTMEPDPWEALDLDASDLPSLLRPCKRKPRYSPPPSPIKNLQPTPNSPPPSSPCLIPGPAGAVQAAMLRKIQNKSNPVGIGEEPLPTQEYIRRAVEDPGADDDDFSRAPWLFALEFIRREGLADDGGTIGTPLSWIKTEPKMGNRKVAQIVAVIKSCTPNGLGDLMVTLKDPTGTIDASIHRKVLVEGGFGKDISVGTVLILQKVSIFSPSRSVHYLNITLSNVVKAISKDSGPPSQQNYPASTVIPTDHGVENSKQPYIQQKVSTLSQERTEGIMNSLRQTGYMRGRVHNDKGIEGNEALGSSCCINERNRNQNAFIGKGHSVRQDILSGLKKAAVLAGTNEYEENVVLEKQSSPRNLAASGNHVESNQSSGGANLVGVASNQKTVTDNGDKKQGRLPISSGSLPQWTDEQLDELFAFD